VNSHLLQLIPDYVLGTLAEDEKQAVDALISRSPEFRREVDRVADSLASSAEALLPAAPPASRAVRARLLRTVSGIERFAPFFDDLTRLFQLPVEAIRALLARIDDASRPWERSLLGRALHGSELFHFTVGPQLAAAGAAGGVLRLDAGQNFPVHRHHGNEVTYVLEGGYMADGRVYGPGSQIEMPGDTSHDYQAAPERDLVIMVLHRGISFE
jgi:quercetin dioxygenase-like cupin family protein